MLTSFNLVFCLLAIVFELSASAIGASLSVEIVPIPTGDYISGSTPQEREQAYRLDEAAYGHSTTRSQAWYSSEYQQHTRFVSSFSIMKNLVTVCDYQQFIDATGYPAPSINQEQWIALGLNHSYQATKRFQWVDGQPPLSGRCDHPVVLVSYSDASMYAKWLSELTGQLWRLPDEFEWEKAARGLEGNRFPWGDQFDPSKLNSHDKGPFDTLPVGSFKSGASPFGLLDVAGQVFEWTLSGDGKNRYIVKGGGSWDDKGCGVCRAAARHYRPEKLKHILIGFRLVTEVE